jgi:hypothetical protein
LFIFLFLFCSYAATDPEVIEKEWNGYYLQVCILFVHPLYFLPYQLVSMPLPTLSFPLQDPASPGKETSQASDPKLGTALWELSERMVKEVVGEDALLPWTA